MIKYVYLLSIAFQMVFGWGSTGHKIINKNAVIHLPPSMQKFIDQQAFLELHSTDPDTRRQSSDTGMFSEQYRHFLDVDDYPDFKNLDRNFNNLISLYGWNRVKGNGTNPWYLVWCMDSLTAQLKRGDWNTAYQTAADIGHYVGDPHQPLHAAVNYNGQLTGNTGIHSRYETTMLNSYQSEITIVKEPVKYVDDIYGFAFGYILRSNSLIDSIFHADNAAKAATGWNGSGTAPAQYYAILWQRLGAMTKVQIQSATINLASLWYTAWVNAGLISKPADVKKNTSRKLKSYNLHQNYPNPFNPKTTIQFEIAEQGTVKLEILSLEGKIIASLIDADLEDGVYTADWNAGELSSGIYLCQLTTEHFSQTKKIVFIK